MGRVKVGILGGGWFGAFHLENLLKMENAQVVAFATGNSQRLAALAKKAPEANTYTTQQQLVEKEAGLDALIVCVPPDSHDGIEELAAQKGIHLYMEKPLGVDWAQVKANETALTKAGVITSVGYQTRYSPQADEVKAFLARQEIGTVAAKWIGVMPTTPWWRLKARSGGQLAEQATHIIDLLRYFFGDITSVYSKSRKGFITKVPDYDGEDVSTSVITFENGMLATLTCGCFVKEEKQNSEIRIEMYGKEGGAQFQWDSKASYGNKQGKTTRYFGNDFHYTALKTFIDAVETKNPKAIRSSYSDGVKTFKATCAANLSMASGQEVALADL